MLAVSWLTFIRMFLLLCFLTDNDRSCIAVCTTFSFSELRNGVVVQRLLSFPTYSVVPPAFSYSGDNTTWSIAFPMEPINLPFGLSVRLSLGVPLVLICVRRGVGALLRSVFSA